MSFCVTCKLPLKLLEAEIFLKAIISLVNATFINNMKLKDFRIFLNLYFHIWILKEKNKQKQKQQIINFVR